MSRRARPVGRVALVGAGPGDPGSITVRGLAALRAADAIVHDRLVSKELLACAGPGVELIDAGKARGNHTMTQAEIEATLIDLARSGKKVVRLKGGDPFVFGRGGEEAQALAGANIDFEVIPGVSSAIAGPAAAGIPVTHRDVASSVAIVSAHASADGKGSRSDWAALATMDTVVLMMGVKQLEESTRALIQAGRAPSTPAAVIQDATLPSQRTVSGSLKQIATRARAAGVRAPAVVVIGDVAALRPTIGGWDTRPLSGVRCLVTRTREQAGSLSGALADLGAEVVEAPAIRVEPPRSWARVDRALGQIHTYDWLVLTSVNGVRVLFERLNASGRDARALGGVRIAATGPGTAAALADHGITADLVPKTFTTEAVGRAFPRAAGRVLLARADIVEPGLEEILVKKGWRCDRVTLYHLRSVKRMEARVRRAVLDGQIDVLTFASGGTVRAFMHLLAAKPPASVRIACIGPVTARAAREAGLRVDAIAPEHTIAGLAAATVAATRKPGRAKRLPRKAVPAP